MPAVEEVLVKCLRAPVPEIQEAALLLDAAVNAHILGDRSMALELIQKANIAEIRSWTESLWGKRSPYVRQYNAAVSLPLVAKVARLGLRMPASDRKKQLLVRDGYHCRFCGIPLVRREVRERIRKYYPSIWGRTNSLQHAAFQAMWVQYDHIVPYSRGGDDSLENMVITCAPCNYSRMEFTLAEVGLSDPRSRAPIKSAWDGLERFR